jgi:hypothetical protein
LNAGAAVPNIGAAVEPSLVSIHRPSTSMEAKVRIAGSIPHDPPGISVSLDDFHAGLDL